jgi:hypothetical protein
MTDILRIVKSSGVISAIKRFVPRPIQNALFSFSMERNKNLLRKVVLGYGGGGDYSASSRLIESTLPTLQKSG